MDLPRGEVPFPRVGFEAGQRPRVAQMLADLGRQLDNPTRQEAEPSVLHKAREAITRMFPG